jgi:hypothetical protein
VTIPYRLGGDIVSIRCCTRALSDRTALSSGGGPSAPELLGVVQVPGLDDATTSSAMFVAWSATRSRLFTMKMKPASWPDRSGCCCRVGEAVAVGHLELADGYAGSGGDVHLGPVR